MLSIIMLSVVIDTNIFVSALLTDGSASRRVLRLCFENKIEPLMGNALFSEYEALISRQTIFEKSLLKPKQRELFLDDFLSVCRWIDVYYLWRPNLRDEADNHLIELAVAGSAKYLITNNLKDFKNAELLFPELKIIKPAEFIKTLESM